MRNTLFLILSCLFVSVHSYAQPYGKVVAARSGLYPSLVIFPENRAPDFIKGKIALAGDQAQVESIQAADAIGYERDVLGTEHYRYQQMKDGIPIEHAEYILHVTDGKVRSQNGVWIKDPRPFANKPTLRESQALQQAMQAISARIYKWQVSAEEAQLKKERMNPTASYYPIGKLVYYSGESGVDPDALRLAYKFDIYAEEPVSRHIIYIDAVTGEVLGSEELLHVANVTGNAATVYSGSKSINSDYTAGTYRLRETGRGNGIETYNLKKTTVYSSGVDFTDSDNNWNNVNASLDQYAADAHWGAETTYDFFKLKFNRNSIDNKGYILRSYVHYSTNYFNAFWDGTRMVYGDGSATNNYKPLTSLDICGHEISHGITSYTSNLTYSYESGALNEGFSDIFGTAIEFYARPNNADWQLGKDFGYVLRDMSNPNLKGHPDTYFGKYWYSGTGDNGGVHTNSGVLNYWFYLLCMGGTGTNDFGFSFKVIGLGMDKAAAIAYRTNTVYLTSSSKFRDARMLSIQAAKDLYGISSNEALQVTNAWNAVGVAEPAPPPPCSNNFEPNESLTAALPIIVNKDTVALITTSTDKDWYKFSTTSGATNVSVYLTNLPADYDLRLYNSAGTQLKVSQNAGTADERIVYNTSSSATYYVQVVGYSGAYNASKCYLLRVSTSGTALMQESVLLSAKVAAPTMENSVAFSVYPNPAHQQLAVRWTSSGNYNATLSLYSITGQEIKRRAIAVREGYNSFVMPLQGIASGAYMLKVNGAGASYQTKVLVD